jgi:hypothetical protein
MTNLRDVAENPQKGHCRHDPYGRCIECIESILREVAQEAILDDRMKRTADGIYALSRSAARAEMREEIAKFIEQTPGNTYTTDCDHADLAGEIRAVGKI